jgi:tRNA A-37 threonylcarbamoyl transferase component Bud32
MKRVAPRLSTPGPGLPQTSDARLPADLLNDQVRRLEIFALVSGGLWAMGLLMDAVIFPLSIGAESPNTAALVIEAGAVLVAATIYAWVHFSGGTAEAKSDIGMWLMLLNSAGIALLETWASEPRLMLGHLSWTAVVILLSAMILPSTPRKMLVYALASASMGPFGVWLAHLRGLDVPSPLNTFLMYMPCYSCAVAAVVPARMMQRLGRSLKEARDLGSYELQERLGEGGMGEVWRARHRLLARPAAIKLIRPEMLAAGNEAESRKTLRRFEHEAQATAALTSPHTIRLFDFGVTDEGSFYYVMELLAGRDMASLVAEFGPLPSARVLFLLRQVCHSLEEAHSQGLVHRDVKPANIFVCHMGLEYDVVKVLDFGLVQFTGPEPAQDLTQSLAALEGVVGTPAFMAPEVIVGKTVDHRADIYALGCVAYYLLTGQQVFQGSSQMQALIDHVNTVPAPPSERAPARVPRSVDALVLACLEKDPDKRPSDARAILEAIATCEGSEGWSNAQAAAWWRAHLPALAAGSSTEPGDRNVTPADAATGQLLRPRR